MKKVLILCLSMLLVFAVVGCQKAETNNAGYSITIKDNYPIENQLKASYQAGEEVTVELSTITEQYYVLSVNGVKQEQTKSDLSSTFFTFTMPAEDVVVDIKVVSVEIPTAPQYALTVTEGAWMLYEQPNEKYSLGTQVVLKVDMAWDVSIVCLVNGESIGEPTEEDDNGTPYLRFEFTMPNENVNIELIMFDNEGFFSDEDYPSEGKYELETDEQEQIRLILLRKDGMWLGMPECEWSWAFEVKDSDGTKLDLHLCRCHTIIDMTNRRSITLFDSEYQQILDILSNHKEPSVQG